MKHETIEKLITKKQVAEVLGIHPRTVTRLVTEGRIPVIRVGRTAVRFRLSDVLAALECREE